MWGLIARRWQWALPVLIIVPLTNLVPLIVRQPTALPLLLGLHLPIYMVHQVEEHLWPGGFRAFVNRQIFRSNDAALPISAGVIAFINIGLVWVPIVLGAMPQIIWPGFLWIGLAMVMVSLINGVVHGLVAMVMRQRNPGLFTGAVLLIPFSIWVLRSAFTQGLLGWHQLVILLGVAGLAHGVIAIMLARPWLWASKICRA